MNKTKVYHIIEKKLNSKIQNLDNLIFEARQSNTETKSSMGDKYETSREMVQQEISKLQWQHNEFLKYKNVLATVKFAQLPKVGLGSLVQTDKGWFFIAVSLGTVEYENYQIFTVSQDSPVAKALMNKYIGDSAIVNETKHNILQIY